MRGHPDINGDGNLDMIVGNYDQAIKVYFGNGIGGFRMAYSLPVSWGLRFVSITLGDFDNDGGTFVRRVRAAASSSADGSLLCAAVSHACGRRP